MDLVGWVGVCAGPKASCHTSFRLPNVLEAGSGPGIQTQRVVRSLIIYGHLFGAMTRSVRDFAGNRIKHKAIKPVIGMVWYELVLVW
ncbi:Uncharacterized protein HZ326_23820 [Fusarium oxysporum f. sp. albedinis]|nr:Uncharacterized protein HZ326_23820 [Fusarium oxysporum f. sp. albedinis]